MKLFSIKNLVAIMAATVLLTGGSVKAAGGEAEINAAIAALNSRVEALEGAPAGASVAAATDLALSPEGERFIRLLGNGGFYFSTFGAVLLYLAVISKAENMEQRVFFDKVAEVGADLLKVPVEGLKVLSSKFGGFLKLYSAEGRASFIKWFHCDNTGKLRYDAIVRAAVITISTVEIARLLLNAGNPAYRTLTTRLAGWSTEWVTWAYNAVTTGLQNFQANSFPVILGGRPAAPGA